MIDIIINNICNILSCLSEQLSKHKESKMTHERFVYVLSMDMVSVTVIPTAHTKDSQAI